MSHLRTEGQLLTQINVHLICLALWFSLLILQLLYIKALIGKDMPTSKPSPIYQNQNQNQQLTPGNNENQKNSHSACRMSIFKYRMLNEFPLNLCSSQRHAYMMVGSATLFFLLRLRLPLAETIAICFLVDFGLFCGHSLFNCILNSYLQPSKVQSPTSDQLTEASSDKNVEESEERQPSKLTICYCLFSCISVSLSFYFFMVYPYSTLTAADKISCIGLYLLINFLLLRSTIVLFSILLELMMNSSNQLLTNYSFLFHSEQTTEPVQVQHHEDQKQLQQEPQLQFDEIDIIENIGQGEMSPSQESRLNNEIILANQDQISPLKFQILPRSTISVSKSVSSKKSSILSKIPQCQRPIRVQRISFEQQENSNPNTMNTQIQKKQNDIQ